MPQNLKLKVWTKTKLLCYGSFLLVTNLVSTLLHVFHNRRNRWKNFVKRSIILKFVRNIIRYLALCLEGINTVNYYSPSPYSILKKRWRDLRLSLNEYLLLAYYVVTQTVKNLPAMGKPGFDPWVGKISWRRAWLPTPVFSPGESPWIEEPGVLQSIGLQRVRHDWSNEHAH